MNGELTHYVKSMRLKLHDLAQPLSVLAGMVDLLMIEAEPASQLSNEMQHLSTHLQVILDKMAEIRQIAQQINTLVEN